MLAPLLRATACGDITQLHASMAQSRDAVRDCFHRYIGSTLQENES
jgi:hypothetical protein